MEGYVAKIVDSSRELSKKEKVMAKDTSNAFAIDGELSGEVDSIVINPDYYVVLDIENERSKGEKNYRKFVIVDKSGKKYSTGSESFWTSFMLIFTEMEGEDFSIEVFRKPSRNYSGKYFISCSLI